MTGVLMIESLTRGNTLKQGDKTPLSYKLLDADGDNLNVAGKTATVRLMYPNYLTIGYEKTGLTVQTDDTVTFTIDNIIPARKYHVEIIVDNKFVFPSRSVESKFTIDKSSLGTETNIIEIIGKDVLINAVKSQVDTDLQPLVTSMEAARQAEIQRASVEASRVSAEAQRIIDHANRSAELAGKADKVIIENMVVNGDKVSSHTLTERSYVYMTSAGLFTGTFGTAASIYVYKDHKYYMYRKLSKGAVRDVIYLNNVTTGSGLFNSGLDSFVETDEFSNIIIPTYNTSAIISSYSNLVGEKTHDKTIFIDLTAAFGAGKEPTKNEMDIIIQELGHFNGEYTLSTTEMIRPLVTGKADKVVLKNELLDPTFNNGLLAWSRSVDHEAVANGNEVTITTNYQGRLGLYQSYNKEGVKYVSAEFYSEDRSALFTLGNTGIVTTIPDGVWTRVSTVNSDKGLMRFYADSGPDNHYIIRHPMVINLTETFGAGNEPTKEEMDELIKVTGYIDDTYALNNKEMLSSVMKINHEKANKKQEDWITPTLLNGWERQTSTQTPEYMKDEFGFVHFRGCIKNGTDPLVFNLPEGYRPRGTRRFPLTSGDNTVQNIVINANLVQIRGNSSAYTYIDSVTFEAEV